MASTVLSGVSNPSYRNNTGQNVRIVINYMQSINSTVLVTESQARPFLFNAPFPQPSLVLTWAGLSVGKTGALETTIVIGRNLASFTQKTNAATNNGNSLGTASRGGDENFALPTELMLAPGETFSAICGIYNIVVIPEEG